MGAAIFLCLSSSSLSLLVASADVVNVALGARASYCDRNETVREVTDGDKSTATGFVTDEPCKDTSMVIVELGGMFYIHYVVVYEARRAEDGGAPRGQLDYFFVQVQDWIGFSFCSNYPNPSIGPIQGRGMRVNCLSFSKVFHTLTVISRKNTGMSVAEIEAFSFASSNGYDFIWIPRGCYERLTGDISFEMQNWRHCKLGCMQNGFALAAIKNNEECICLSKYHESLHRPPTECDNKCTDSDYYCGGRERFSLYLVNLEVPKYVGCIKQLAVQGETFSDENMTPDLCLARCKNSSRALLQRGDTCKCVNSEEGLNFFNGVGSEHCNSRCSGDPESFCGAVDFVSVYRPCYISGHFRTACSTLFRCRGEMDRYGVCKDGCQDGFVGDYCLHSALQIENTTECPTNLCNPRTSKCKHLNGSYFCECKSKYLQILNRCIASSSIITAVGILMMVMLG